MSMQSEHEVKERLKTTLARRKKAKLDFDKYDNVEDMYALDTLAAEIEVLKWVLGTKGAV